MADKYANIHQNKVVSRRTKKYPFTVNCFDENHCLAEAYDCRNWMEAYAYALYWVEDEKPEDVELQ